VEPLRRGLKLLEEGNFDEAEKTADEMLAGFQDHPAFSALKRAVQEARNQAAAAYRDEIARRLGDERNLGQREAILVEALRRFPDEPFFKLELDSVHENQQLVARVLKDARDAEQAGRYEEALGQWETVRTLDADYPKLDTEMQRLDALLASARAAAREAALTEVRTAIEKGSLQQADILLSRVESEFGANASDDCAHIRVRLEGLIAAMHLADEGRGLFAKGDCSAGSAKFLQAARRIPNERIVIERFLGELIQQAEAIVESDWRAADSILQAVSDLKPDSAVLTALRARVKESRREEHVARVLEESQRLWDAGELGSSAKSIQEALALYPAETRLTERLAVMQAVLKEKTRRLLRDQIVADLTAIAREVETANLKQLRTLGKQIDTVSARAASDPEIQESVIEVKQALATRISELEAPQPMAASAYSGNAEPIAATVSRVRVPMGKTIAIGAGVAAVLIATLVTVSRWTNSGRQTTVSVTSDVAGVSVTVGNQSCVTPGCGLNLPPGTYNLIARRDGFKTITQPITVSPRQGELRLPLALEPWPQVLQVNTNFESGQVFLDGHPAGNLRDGQFSITDLAPGQHTIRVTGGGAAFQTAWRSTIGARPELVGQIEAKDVQVTAIANAGSTAAIACNCGVQNITVDGAPAGQTQAANGASSPLRNLAEGSRQLSFAGHSLILDVRPNPTLSLFLSLDRNVGTIVVEAGEDKARVYLNNQVYRSTTQHGTVRVPVDVGEYSVRVEKDGFQGPAARTITVRKGDEERVVMLLKPVPPLMEIAGALPGAEVKVDGRPVGEIGSNGALRSEAAPGAHVIELTKDGYAPARFAAQFTPGKTVRPDQGQLTMARVIKPPAPPDPKQIDAQDWDRVRNSNNIDGLEDYVRKHPDGAHVDEARTIMTRLRQDAQANAARQAEQAAWDATDKTNKAALQEFLSRYVNGAHGQEARGLISGVEKQESDALASALRAKELKSKELRDKEQEQANRAAADQQSIVQFLAAYEAAYNLKDLKTLQGMWKAMRKSDSDATSRQFRDARSLTFQMRPIGQAVINGDSALINCTRVLSLISKDGQRPPVVNERVLVTLNRVGSGWAISSIAAL
jgi:PEGA domain